MKRILIALAASSALIGAAQAGDLNHRGGLKDPVERQGRLPEPEVQQEYDAKWTRFWGAVVGGYGMTNTEVSAEGKGPFNPLVDGLGAEGIFGEVQVGYDKDLGPIVIGIYGGAGYSDATFGAIGLDILEQKESYFVGLRGGIPLTSKTLGYVAGGWRWTTFEVADDLKCKGDCSDTLDGAFAEAGIDGRLTKMMGWKVFGRYTFYDEYEGHGSLKGLTADVGELQVGAGLTISLGGF